VPGRPVGTLSLMVSYRSGLKLRTSSGKAKCNPACPADFPTRLGVWMESREGYMDRGVVLSHSIRG
jgi:hypothetical protein